MARPSRAALGLIAGAALLLALVVAFVAWRVGGTDDDAAAVDPGDPTPVLQVDDAVTTAGELQAQLEAITGNELYVQVRREQGNPLATERADDGSFSPDLVADTLTDWLQFELARRALAAHGGTITDADRTAARGTMAELLVGKAQLATGEDATLEAVLEQFGVARPLIEDGLAAVQALQRVVGEELGPEATDAEIDAAVSAALTDAAASARITVDPAYGAYDAESLSIVAVDRSEGELVPVDPDETGVPVGPPSAIEVPPSASEVPAPTDAAPDAGAGAGT